MHERYTIQKEYINNGEYPDVFTVGYMDRYGGASFQVRWQPVETFYNEDVAKRVCDELNAKRILDE